MTRPEFNQSSAAAAPASSAAPAEIDFLRTLNRALVLLTTEERDKAREQDIFAGIGREVTRIVFASHRAGRFADLKAEEDARIKAKQETVEKVCEIVKKQLALSEETEVAGHSEFSDLAADSLDMVEIVMGLEEAFGISMQEQNAQSIVTVHDAAELIDKLVAEKA